jgi:hypothetical protein
MRQGPPLPLLHLVMIVYNCTPCVLSPCGRASPTRVAAPPAVAATFGGGRGGGDCDSGAGLAAAVAAPMWLRVVCAFTRQATSRRRGA